MAVTRSGAAVSAASETLSITIGAVTDGCLVVNHNTEHTSSHTHDSADYGGQALVEAIQIGIGASNHNVSSIWYLLDSAIAAASNTTLTMTCSTANPDSEMLTAAAYEGVNQTGGATTLIATNSYASDSSPANPALCDLTEVTDGLVVAGYNYESVGSISWNAAMNELSDISSSSAQGSMADRLSTTSANVDIEATAGATPSRVAMVSAAFAPAVSLSLTEATHASYNDGTESGSTIIGAVGDNLSIATETTFQIRQGIQAVGNPASKTFKFQFRKTGDATSEWEDFA